MHACLTKVATYSLETGDETIMMIVLPKGESEVPANNDSISNNDSYAQVEESFESLVEETPVISLIERIRLRLIESCKAQ